MICSKLGQTLGFSCQPIDDAGTIAMIETPIRFSDGDGLVLYSEMVGEKIRFFDDGEILLHFITRGLKLESGNNTKFIAKACKENSIALSPSGEIESWGELSSAADAFNRMLATIYRLTAWEKEHIGASTDTSLLIDEVAMHLQAIGQGKSIKRNPTLSGFSGLSHSFDLDWEGTLVSAIHPHHAAVGSMLRKTLDIKASPHHQNLQFLVVLDDRKDPGGAKREASVFISVAKVTMLSELQARAKQPVSAS